MLKYVDYKWEAPAKLQIVFSEVSGGLMLLHLQ